MYWLLFCLFSVTLAVECEYAIVGSGFSGIYYAWRLTQPPLSLSPSSLCIYEAHPKRIGGRAYAFPVEDVAEWDSRTIVEMGSYRFHSSEHELVRSVVMDVLDLPTQCYHPECNPVDDYLRVTIPDGPGKGNPGGYVKALQGLLDILLAGGMPPIMMNHRLVSVFDANQPLPPPPPCDDPTTATSNATTTTTFNNNVVPNGLMTLRFRVEHPIEGCTWVDKNTTQVVLNIPSTSLHTLTDDSVVFTKARPEVLNAYQKPFHQPLVKIYLVYDFAWWKVHLNLTSTTFDLEATDKDEISLSGRFYDGATFNNCTNQTVCPGVLFTYYDTAVPSQIGLIQELLLLKGSSLDPATRLLPGHALTNDLFNKIHNGILDYFEGPLLQAGLDPALLPQPRSAIYSMWWSVDYESALCPAFEGFEGDDSCDVSQLFFRPTTEYDLFLVNEAWGCEEHGWAENALRLAEKILVWRYKYTKPANVSEVYWQTQVLGGNARSDATLLPRLPDCFVSADCANGSVCIDYFCAPQCTNVTDCASLLAPCREVSCGTQGVCQVKFLNSSCSSNLSCTLDFCHYGYCETVAPKCEAPPNPECVETECILGNCSLDIKVNASCADPDHPCGGKCDAQGLCQKIGGAPLGAACVLGTECCSGYCLHSVCANVPQPECTFLAPNFHMGWHIHDDNDLVTFVFASNSSGWVALGLGDSMTNADVWAAWIDPISGVGVVDDYWSTGTRTPRLDIDQGGTYDLLNAKVESLPSAVISVTITRKLNTGDIKDRVVDLNENSFIYAFKNGRPGDFTIHDEYNIVSVLMKCREVPPASHMRPDRKPTQVIAGEPAVTRITAFDKNYNRLRSGGFAPLFRAQSSIGKLETKVDDLENGRYLVSLNLTHADAAFNYSILFNDSLIDSPYVSVEILPANFATAVADGLLVPVAAELYPFWLVATDVFLNPCIESEALANRDAIYAVAYVVEKEVREELPTVCSTTLSPYGKGQLGFACTFDTPHGAEVQHYIDVRVHGADTPASPYFVPHTPHEWATWVIWLLVISIAIILCLCTFIFRIWRKEKLAKHLENHHKKQTSSVSQRGYGALVEA